MNTQTEQTAEKISVRKAICQAYGIREEDLGMHTRKREIVNARKCYAHIVSKEIGKGPSITARKLSVWASHADIIYYCKQYMNHRLTEIDFKKRSDLVLSQLEDGIIDVKCL